MATFVEATILDQVTSTIRRIVNLDSISSVEVTEYEQTDENGNVTTENDYIINLGSGHHYYVSELDFQKVVDHITGSSGTHTYLP